MSFQDNSEQGSKRLAALLAGALIAGLAVVGFARGGRQSGTSGGPGAGSGGVMMDDEAIGSLPAQGGGLLFLMPGEAPVQLPPTLYLSGPTERLLAGLVHAQGAGHVSLYAAGDEGRSIAIVHGTLHLQLDARLFADPDVTVGLMVGSELRRTQAGLFLGGRLVQRRELGPLGRFELPLGALYREGLLEEGLDLFALRAGGGRDHVRISATGGLISLHQMN